MTDSRIITNGYIDKIEPYILKSNITKNLNIYHSLRPKKEYKNNLTIPSKAFLNRKKDDLEFKSSSFLTDIADVTFLIKRSLEGERFISDSCPIHTYKPMVVEQVKNTPYWKIGCYFEGCKYDTDTIQYRFNTERETIIAWNLHFLKNIEYLPKDFRKFIKVLKYFYGRQIEKIFNSDDKICYDKIIIEKINYYCNEIMTIIKFLLSRDNSKRLVLNCPICGKEPKIIDKNKYKIGCCKNVVKFPILEYATLSWNLLILKNIFK